jgi:hypothetical protein
MVIEPNSGGDSQPWKKNLNRTVSHLWSGSVDKNNIQSPIRNLFARLYTIVSHWTTSRQADSQPLRL